MNKWTNIVIVNQLNELLVCPDTNECIFLESSCCCACNLTTQLSKSTAKIKHKKILLCSATLNTMGMTTTTQQWLLTTDTTRPRQRKRKQCNNSAINLIMVDQARQHWNTNLNIKGFFCVFYFELKITTKTCPTLLTTLLFNLMRHGKPQGSVPQHTAAAPRRWSTAKQWLDELRYIKTAAAELLLSMLCYRLVSTRNLLIAPINCWKFRNMIKWLHFQSKAF